MCGMLITLGRADVDVEGTSHPEFHLSERCATARTTPFKGWAALRAKQLFGYASLGLRYEAGEGW
jgi:hypothetical protein